jgi:aminopeptidase N
MPGQRSPIVLLAALSLCIAAPVFAQKPDTRALLRMIGDGAAECSAAKKAAALRAPRNHFSVASSNFDATYYHLDLFFPMDVDSVRGTVRVEGRVINSTMTRLTLDLASSMVVSSVRLPDATPLAYTHPGAALNITLPSPQAPGSTVSVDITYRGIPVSDGFGNFVFGTRSVDNNRYAWSLSEPYGAREWWPCKDHPSDKADSVRVTVRVPSNYRVGSQGILVSEVPAGQHTTYDWVSRYPIASYLVSVAIGVYAEHAQVYVRSPALEAEHGPLSLPLYHLRYNDGTPDLPPGWAATPDVLDVQESWFGPYPFSAEKYGHAEFTFGGGMEHQTLTSMGTSALAVVVHEAAHQWYGDSVTPKSWRDIWLNEGFATYAEMMYFVERESTYPGFYDAMFNSRYDSAKRATGTLVVQDTTDVDELFDGNRSYAKGGMVLYMLHHMVDDAVFESILKRHAEEAGAKYGNASTADLQRIAESESGLDLDGFFRQWVTHGTGYPTYSASKSWTRVAGGYDVTVKLAQQQMQPQSNWTVFRMPVEIALMAQSGDSLLEVHRETVQNTERTQEFNFNVSLPDTVTIAQVQIDPDRRILRGTITAIAPTPSIPVITSMAPNPNRGSAQLRYSLPTDSALEIRVYDVRGRRVLTQTAAGAAGGGAVDINTTSLASGVYFLRLSTAAGIAKTKFVVVK